MMIRLSQTTDHNERGFALPTLIILMVLIAVVSYSALLAANNSLNLGYKQAYIQMARVASKSAIDYAQEQFDNSVCGSYSGTAEQDLISNSRYRVSIKAEVLSTSADGLEKKVKGTGSVYLPKLSVTAQYVFDIRSEVVRTYAACKTPDNFGPMVWLDASDPNTLKKIGTNTITINASTSFGSSSNSTRDTLEEKVNDGAQTTASWESNDLELHTCDGAEFSNSICNSNSTKYTYGGVVLQNVNVPKNATISSATLKFTGGTPSGTGGSLTHRVYGIYKNAGNPHIDLFTSTGTGQIKNRLSDSAQHTTSYGDVTTNNFPPGNTANFDVTAIVQEMVNNDNWDTGNNSGRIGFSLQRVSGNGSRRGLKNGVQLSVTYSVSTIIPALNGDGIAQWNDLSGNGNHAKLAYGNGPLRVDNQINNKTIVRFDNDALLSTLTSALAGKREATVLAVVKPNFTTSASDGRVISGMTSTNTNDTTAPGSIIPLMRAATGSGFSNIYSGGGSTYRNDYTCGSACADIPYIFSSIFTVDPATSTITSALKGQGAPVSQETGYAPPTGSPPYVYNIDQLYWGGRRSGALPGSGTDYFNGDYAELVIYDKALACREIEALEEYLRAKWAVSTDAYTTTCPADTVPTL